MKVSVGTLLRWLALAQFRLQPGRTLASVVAVAIGVALALAIQLVNGSALSAFRQALGTVNGEADLRILPTRGWLEDRWADTVAAVDGVALASPVLEATLVIETGDGGRTDLPLVAVDFPAAAGVTPDLLPVPAGGERPRLPAFEADVVHLSPAARRLHGLSRPDATAGADAPRLRVATPAGPRSLRVADDLLVAGDPVLAVMDLGSAQWLLQQTGRLTRIDVRLGDAASAGDVARRLAAVLPAALQVGAPADEEQRASNLSRAYRVNLNVLALVALLTGGFIVFAAMSLAALRQQHEFALLVVLGAPPGLATRSLIGQAAAIGVAGSLLGIGGGIGAAVLMLRLVGGDLGGGYFGLVRPELSLDPAAIAGFGLLGIATALAGALAPALAVRTLPAMRVLRTGSAVERHAPARARRRVALALGLVATGALLSQLPAVAGLPIAAYAAIAAILFAGIALVPAVIGGGLGLLLDAAPGPVWRRPPVWLGLTHQRQAPDAVAVALAGVVASFALSSAMVVMVASFRGSVDDWLGRVLPADLYVRIPPALQSGLAADGTLTARLRAIDGVGRVETSRAQSLQLAPDLPPIMLLARESLADALPLTGEALTGPLPAGTIAAFVTEAMVSRYGFRVGTTQRLPLAAEPTAIHVRGVWRDYARQTGAVAIALPDYRRITGDFAISDVAVRKASRDVDDAALVARLRSADPALARADWRSAAEIRDLSLAIFDRSFAITYALEAIAILVSLFGVASTYAAQALTRTREFGMLRHLGVSRRQLVAQLATESIAGTTLALAWGGLIGLVIAWILIARVNPQSFHWTMDVAIPVSILLPSALAVLVTAVATAMVATRSASSGEPIAALRRDW